MVCFCPVATKYSILLVWQLICCLYGRTIRRTVVSREHFCPVREIERVNSDGRKAFNLQFSDNRPFPMEDNIAFITFQNASALENDIQHDDAFTANRLASRGRIYPNKTFMFPSINMELYTTKCWVEHVSCQFIGEDCISVVIRKVREFVGFHSVSELLAYSTCSSQKGLGQFLWSLLQTAHCRLSKCLLRLASRNKTSNYMSVRTSPNFCFWLSEAECLTKIIPLSFFWSFVLVKNSADLLIKTDCSSNGGVSSVLKRTFATGSVAPRLCAKWKCL